MLPPPTLEFGNDGGTTRERRLACPQGLTTSRGEHASTRDTTDRAEHRTPCRIDDLEDAIPADEHTAASTRAEPPA
ncbi:unnamed protein product [Arctogadus glacialis]